MKAHELCAIWAGKMPHAASIVPGGVSITPRLDNITTSLWRLKELTEFIDTVYIPDVITIAEVYRDYFQIPVVNLFFDGTGDISNQVGIYLKSITQAYTEKSPMPSTSFRRPGKRPAATPWTKVMDDSLQENIFDDEYQSK